VEDRRWGATERPAWSSRGLFAGPTTGGLLGRPQTWDTRQIDREEILSWVDAHRRRTGKWPTYESGPILEAPGVTWAAVNAALREGAQGLRGKTTLAKLLSQHRGKRHCIGSA